MTVRPPPSQQERGTLPSEAPPLSCLAQHWDSLDPAARLILARVPASALIASAKELEKVDILNKEKELLAEAAALDKAATDAKEKRRHHLAAAESEGTRSDNSSTQTRGSSRETGHFTRPTKLVTGKQRSRDQRLRPLRATAAIAAAQPSALAASANLPRSRAHARYAPAPSAATTGRMLPPADPAFPPL